MESTTAAAPVPTTVASGFFDTMGGYLSTIGDSLSDCGSATGQYASSIGSSIVNWTSGVWANYVQPVAGRIHEVGVKFIQQISRLFENARSWVEANPDTAQLVCFTAVFSTAFGCLGHYFMSSRSSNKEKAL